MTINATGTATSAALTTTRQVLLRTRAVQSMEFLIS
jgi:hypothetical protein